MNRSRKKVYKIATGMLGIRALGLAYLLPQALAIISGIDNPSVAETVVLPGIRIIGAPLAEVELLAKSSFRFLSDIT